MKKLLSFISILVFISQGFLMAQNGGFCVTEGGNSGSTITVNNEADFRFYASSVNPYIIKIDGTIDVGSGIDVASNKTIMGINEKSKVNGTINIKNGTNNVIIQYLTISNPLGDGITIREASHVYVNHCTVYDCGDGCIDVTVQSDSVTISYCHFYYKYVSVHKFVNLIGAGDLDTLDRGKLHVTLHHNWYGQKCESRMPRVRYGRVHTYNNYFSCWNNNYASRARIEAEILSEYNYFDSIRDPLTVEDGGKARSVGDFFYKCYNSIYPGNDSVFSPTYEYSPTSVECAKNEVMCLAGNIPRNKVFRGTISRITGDNGAFEILHNEEADSIQYKWIYADSVEVTGLPPGILAEKDNNTNIIELSGTPTDTGTYIITLISSGCSLSDTLLDTIKVVDEYSGIASYTYDNSKCLVFPNPSGGDFNISLKGLNDNIREVTIYDILGKIVFQDMCESKSSINIQHSLNKGVYIVMIKGENNEYNQKIIAE